jgi:hypothetical protein
MVLEGQAKWCVPGRGSVVCADGWGWVLLMVLEGQAKWCVPGRGSVVCADG